LNEIEKENINVVNNKANLATLIKDKTNLKKLNNKPNIHHKKSSEQYNTENSENEEDNDDNNNYRKYEIKGYNKKPKRMSIIDILKKRKISIISEQPFKTSRFLDTIKNKENKKKFKNPKLNLVIEKPEIQKYDIGIRYLMFTSSYTRKKKDKWHPDEFELSNEVNINLKGYLQLMREEREREMQKEKERKEKEKEEKEKEKREKEKENLNMNDNKNAIEGYKKKKIISNYVIKNKNSLTINNKSMDKYKNKTKEPSLIKKNIKQNNNKNHKVTFTLDRSAQIKKNSLTDKIKSKDKNNNNNNRINTTSFNINTSNKKQKTKNKRNDDDNRAIKPPILSKYSSSEEEEEEEEEEEKEEEKEFDNTQNDEEEVKGRKPNRFDELLHAYGTNYDYKKDKLSKEKNNGKNIKNEERRYLRNNALKNNINSKNIYTDEKTNQIRKTFKRKLTHHNAYKNVEQDEIGQKNFHKIKTNKAKIKRFKTKNENEYDDNESNVSKKSRNKKPHGNKAKIRKFPNNEKNIINDYEYNNIILQNSTYNQTTFNYYANDKTSRLNTNHTINHSKNKFLTERQNKSVKISGNRIMEKKIKKLK